MRGDETPKGPPKALATLRLMVWATVCALIFGAIGFGEVLEDTLRTARNRAHVHAASGKIVLVDIDDKSLREVGRWPWPRSRHAELIDALTDADARKIVYDVDFSFPGSRGDDAKMAAALRHSGRVWLAGITRVGTDDGTAQELGPHSAFRQVAKIGTMSFNYNYANAVWTNTLGGKIGGIAYPSFSAILADAPMRPGKSFYIDYSIDPNSVPRVSAIDLVRHRVDAAALRDKLVVVGTTSETLNDSYFLPGYGKMGGAYIHILGAETLLAGQQQDFGWLPLLIATLALLAIALRRPTSSQQNLVIAALAAILLLGPVALEMRLIFVQITPSLFAVAYVATRLNWRRLRLRGLTNSLTGLPNLTAFRADRAGRSRPLIAARVRNFAEIVSTLNAASEKRMIEQIVKRLSLGDANRKLFQGDEGIFAWFADNATPIGNHLEALHALFRAPIKVGETGFDVAISFGVELGSNRSIANRLGSALVAADEADAEGIKWKYHDPARLEEVPWRLSLLSQLDSAIEDGQVWVAYQPKLCLKTRRIIGAEALARWTHPTKGPISPTEFIGAAEQHGRIEKLSDFILNAAIESAAKIVRHDFDFSIAVNLSARLLTDRGLPGRIMAILDRHQLAPKRLMLELTETAALGGTGADIDLLGELRRLGIKISIDDYGTGLSTLEYLRKVPASEIKIDQSFIKTMRENRSDLVMVQSTIALAHSLDRIVVAEGVEDPKCLELLESMHCDIAQGYCVGRPMALTELMRRLISERRRHVA